jgi:SAM-dependent methyltransferase
MIGSDTNLINRTIDQTLMYLQLSKKARDQFKVADLQTIWYRSLLDNKLDFSVYDSDLYLAELWSCWVVCSRKYLLSLLNPKYFPPEGVFADMKNVRSVADLGCGIAYSTIALKEMFPKAEVYGTNIEHSKQTEVAIYLSKMHSFKVLYSLPDEHTDLVFASEYFEHFQKPVEHLEEVLNRLKPNYLLIANAFTYSSIGHFNNYSVDGHVIPSDKVSRLFNNRLKDYGYEKVKTKLWNNRPDYWKKRSRQTEN